MGKVTFPRPRKQDDNRVWGREPRSPNLRARVFSANPRYHLQLHCCFSEALRPRGSDSAGLGWGRMVTGLDASRLHCVADHPWLLGFPEWPHPFICHVKRRQVEDGALDQMSCILVLGNLDLWASVSSSVKSGLCDAANITELLRSWGWMHFIFLILKLTYYFASVICVMV